MVCLPKITRFFHQQDCKIFDTVLLGYFHSSEVMGLGILHQLDKNKTHHYIILFVLPLHSKPGMESYCWSSTHHLSW